MLEITLSPIAGEKLKKLLAEEEDYDKPFLRIREVKIGGGWTAHNELRLSIDERDELEDEIEGTFDGLPFILHPDVISAYGEGYSITLDKDGSLIVTSLENVQSANCSLFRPR